MYADGAPHNGLREVDKASSRGLHASNVAGSHPDNFGLSGKMLYVLEKNVVYFGGKSYIFRLGRLAALRAPVSCLDDGLDGLDISG